MANKQKNNIVRPPKRKINSFYSKFVSSQTFGGKAKKKRRKK